MTTDSDLRVGGILLAAGGSSRMGRPKQLVEFEGKTLIRRAAESLTRSQCDPNVVVLGAEITDSLAEIADLPLVSCINDDWASGMSSSIRAGLSKLREIEPDLDAVVITLCDQPRVTADDIDRLMIAFRSGGHEIVAARYDEVAGVPALFAKSLFRELDRLDGDTGARDLIRGGSSVMTVPLEHASLDIDTDSQL